jgi:hypothetical protein
MWYNKTLVKKHNIIILPQQIPISPLKEKWSNTEGSFSLSIVEVHIPKVIISKEPF